MFVDYRVQSLGIFILIVVYWWGFLLTADILWFMWCVFQYSAWHKFLFTFVPLLLCITSGYTLATCVVVSSLFMLMNSFWSVACDLNYSYVLHEWNSPYMYMRTGQWFHGTNLGTFWVPQFWWVLGNVLDKTDDYDNFI